MLLAGCLPRRVAQIEALPRSEPVIALRPLAAGTQSVFRGAAAGAGTVGSAAGQSRARTEEQQHRKSMEGLREYSSDPVELNVHVVSFVSCPCHRPGNLKRTPTSGSQSLPCDVSPRPLLSLRTALRLRRHCNSVIRLTSSPSRTRSDEKRVTRGDTRLRYSSETSPQSVALADASSKRMPPRNVTVPQRKSRIAPKPASNTQSAVPTSG